MNPDLDALERRHGAQFARGDELMLPARFADPQREWAAVREHCGVLDARFRGLLRLTGADRSTFLQGMVTNDVAALRAGQGTYAALLTIQGKLVSDLRVYVLAEEIWLDIPAQRVGAVRAALEHFIIADDVEFAGNEWTPLVAIEGPEAGTVLTRIFGQSVEGLAPFAHRELAPDGVPLRVAAVSHSGESGYLLFGNADGAARVWEQCCAAAAPVGTEALDVLRLEAGIPWFGRDMDDGMLISEVGLETAISYRKGCYLGQEVVERVASRGQVHRKLVGLAVAGQTAPPARAKLVDDGNEIGWITSAAWSPARRGMIALGYVRREYWDPGAQVQVALAQGNAGARVEPLPFYTRSL